MSPRESAARPGDRKVPRLFYDGECGVCHLCVRFLLWADPGGELRLAPLGGESFRRHIPETEREALPDSLVLLTTDGRVLSRSAAVTTLLDGLGGFWRLGGWLTRVVPRPLADAIYDGVARIRHRLAPRPGGACPLVPESARSRFDV